MSDLCTQKSSKRSGADFLFGGREDAIDSDETFSRDLVQRLTESLEAFPLPHLTPSEMEHLIVLIHTTLEVRRPFQTLLSPSNKTPFSR